MFKLMLYIKMEKRGVLLQEIWLFDVLEYGYIQKDFREHGCKR